MSQSPRNRAPGTGKGNRSKSSRRWLDEHFDDPYVKEAQKRGYRSRASFKLLELDERDRLLRPGMTVVDLGAAPGGWSQVVTERLQGQGIVIASDVLQMDHLPDVTFLQGDFTEDAVFQQILACLGDRRADLVISDMAPNMSGMVDVDQPRAMALAELALDFASRVLVPGGVFVTKLFQGEGSDDFHRALRRQFETVVTRKPKASRPRSREVYVVARGFRA